MKKFIIFILTTAILGIIYPVLSNLQTKAEEPQVFDTVIASENTEEEPFYDVNKENPDTSVSDGELFAKLTEENIKEEVKPEPVQVAPVSESKPVETAPVQTPAPAPAPKPVQTPAPEPVKPVVKPDHIEIAGKWVNVYNVDSTALDAGNSVYRFINNAKGYDGRFLYGHNSSNVFGGLKNLSIGNIFTVTLNNETVTYRIAEKVVFEKNQETGKLTLNGAGSHMNNVARAKYNGTQYDLSIMTCHGQSLGHGDATHRLVIFANRI
ncbi:sortase [Candidatus Saccharibacteria bacterium]|nr:sortase [Candidatus Saccharibacteria bacterium]